MCQSKAVRIVSFLDVSSCFEAVAYSMGGNFDVRFGEHDIAQLRIGREKAGSRIQPIKKTRSSGKAVCISLATISLNTITAKRGHYNRRTFKMRANVYDNDLNAEGTYASRRTGDASGQRFEEGWVEKV